MPFPMKIQPAEIDSQALAWRIWLFPFAHQDGIVVEQTENGRDPYKHKMI